MPPHNPRGNFESQTVWGLHNRILRANGGSWRHPPTCVVVDRRRKRALRAVVTRLARHKPCGLKDPRLLLLMDTWQDIAKSYALVGAYRHPVAVARSLAAVALYGTRFGTLRLRFDPLEWLRTARRALPYFLIVVLAAIHMKVDILMLRSMIDSTAVGVYGVAAMIASLACVLIQALMRGLFPAVARASGANAELSAQRALNTLRFPAALGFGVAIGVFVLARPVIAAFFGDDYAGSADCLRILVWFLPSIFVSSTAIRIMAATGRAHWVHRILLVNCALNIAANLVLIPRAGILGASAATVFSSWASASQCIFLLVRRRVRGRPDSAPESRSEGEALDDTAF